MPEDSIAMASGDSRPGLTGVGSASGFVYRFRGMLLSRSSCDIGLDGGGGFGHLTCSGCPGLEGT